MLNRLFSKKPIGQVITFNIQGMHCTSCAMNIDGEIEELDGVYKVDTSYAKSTTTVTFDPQKTDLHTLKKAIKKAGYEAISKE